MFSNSAMASLDLAKSKNCMTCHSIDNKLVGPSFREVAKKYIGQKGVEDALKNKILKGGSGNWGAVAMPPNNQISEADARSLVKWILNLK